MATKILAGDCRDVLRSLPTESIDCIVTSPPYWGLRDYGVDGQIGLEPTMQGYLDAMVGVCRELRRVLKPEGTFWLNIGDSYAANRTYQVHNTRGAAGHTYSKGSTVPEGLKQKDLCMIPNRLAILLQEDGWYVRSEIIWHKPNPMPESVKDRPTCAHEKVWLLTKSDKYFYDADAISEATSNNKPWAQSSNGGTKLGNTPGQSPHKGELGKSLETRNARNVWSMTTKPFKGAHFATMPPDLAERCIKAGCPVGGYVLDPFGGSGTTALAAEKGGRHATLIELNPAYRDIAERRVSADAPLLSGAL